MKNKKMQNKFGAFEILSERFKPQHSEMILSLHYCKLTGDHNENMEELMGYLRVKSNKYGCKEKDRMLKQDFINGIHGGDMMTKIMRELTATQRLKKLLVNKCCTGLKEWSYKGQKKQTRSSKRKQGV